MQARMRAILSGLALSLATLLVLFGALEMLLRFTGSYATEPLLFDPILGYVPKPNSDVTTRSQEYTTLKHVNGEGFWGKEYAHEKPADVERIVVVGDSFTEARQVPTPLSYPALLEDKLNAALGTSSVQVVNLGRGGYGTTRETYILEHYGLAYHPDVVVLGFFVGNDIMNNVGEKDLGKQHLSGWEQIKESVKVFLINDFATVRAYLDLKARNKVFAWMQGDLSTTTAHIIATDVHPYFKDLPDDAKEGYALTEEQLSAMASTTRAAGAKLLVVLIPDRMQVHPQFRLPEYADFDYDQPERILDAYMTEQHIPYLDLLPSLRRAAAATSTLFYGTYDSHYNAAGQAFTANAIADYLLRAPAQGGL